jgi:3-oxoadipate enol-lactonase
MVPTGSTSDGVDFYVTDLTPPWREAPETILFHHGIGTCADCWMDWLPVLADRYRIVTFDLPGHGARPVPVGSPWEWQRLIDDVLSVADAANAARFHLVGESTGGTVALACAADHPDRVVSIGVSNGAFKGASIQNVAAWKDVIDRGGMAAWSDFMMPLRFFDDAVPEAQRYWYERQQAACDPAAVMGILTALQQADLSERLATIAQPTLILHPDSSPFIPVERAETLRQALPDAYLEVFPHTRHGLPFSHGAECAAVLRRFLDGLTDG